MTAVQLHPLPAGTLTLPLPPAAVTEALVGEMEKVPDPEAWLTVKPWPAMVSVPEREVQLSLTVTDQVTEALPVPLPGVQFSQLVALLDAVHVHPAFAVTVTVPLA